MSAHAAASLDRGRSALEGVEALHFKASLVRERVRRRPDPEIVRAVFDRLVKAADGASIGVEGMMVARASGTEPLLGDRKPPLDYRASVMR